MDELVVGSQGNPYMTQHSQRIVEIKQMVKRRRSRGSSSNEDDVAGMLMMRKRKLSDEQVKMLEYRFEKEHKLESGRKDKIAGELGLDPKQVAVWFQNRRARWKTKKLEDQYTSLKSQHNTVVLHQCHLESQVLKLREQVSEAQIEIKRLTERLEEKSTNSSTSSISVKANDAPLLEFDFAPPTHYNIPFYISDNICVQEDMDYWDDFSVL